MKKSLSLKLWLTIIALVLGVFLFSILVQAQQIRTLIYNQQAKFYIYEAQEVVTIYNTYKDTEGERINERFRILGKFLNANISIANLDGELLYGQPLNEPLERILHEPGFKEKVSSGNNVVYSGKLPGVIDEIFLVVVPLKDQSKNLGSVVISSPLSTIKQHVNSILVIALIGAVIGIILATIISVFISRKLVRPLIKMEETAQYIAEGEYGRQIQVASEDEVGRLAHSFNVMSSELKGKIDDIERLDRLRQELLSDVSHELRTPLTVIQGFSEAILDGLVKSKEQEQHYLKLIIDETERLRELVDDLQDLKGLEAINSLDDMDYIVLNKLVQISAERLKHFAESKEIQLNVILPKQQITIWGNSDRLKQVLTNLMDNAIKHSDLNGTISIQLGIENSWAFIAVKDSGPGIPQEELENIWERFYKVDKSRSRRGTGTGLGLSIVKKITEMHGGKVAAESKLGNGTMFTVYFPLEN
ncbi:signal transduction histidine kinase [Desulfitobacterium dichloroeliminans LMG P-21439]|uniref:histidine kinase n=1 Tax=Desulfitobacterium dichloroeliminans (strain LMG P-21439 / DCA1) TaxID=871963 RepID=L0F6K0_DESDL|nr:ATP-binding protein [Desulfitobacterium dichloroeliminans]AGA68645.1 signal transduction histidine kinase [Desulfitobacterium dichloroeliminans LMG P-21439]